MSSGDRTATPEWKDDRPWMDASRNGTTTSKHIHVIPPNKYVGGGTSMKTRFALLTVCFLTAGLLGATAPARAQSEQAAADFTPWSGYWWPHKEGRIVGPLTKYDQATGARAANWERTHHPRGSAAGWAGFCHAWSAA